jgi:AcrR family transcriptional regulator
MSSERPRSPAPRGSHDARPPNGASHGKRRYELKERAKRQQETRRRIAAATASLHEEVGPAHTTITEIARRAGVQRPTVYANFPTDRELFAACQAHFMAEHPLPDLDPALADPDPVERVRRVLEPLYRRYGVTVAMTGNVQRDRRLLPALDALTETRGRRLDALADAFSRPCHSVDGDAGRCSGYASNSPRGNGSRGSLSDEAAAGLMTDAVGRRIPEAALRRPSSATATLTSRRPWSSSASPRSSARRESVETPRQPDRAHQPWADVWGLPRPFDEGRMA